MRVAVNGAATYHVDARALKKACVKAMKAEGVRRDAELSVSVVSAGEMSELNQRYLHRDGPTDVLAFPMQEEDTRAFLLGDVIICPDFVSERKYQYDIDDGKELEFVAVHGLLHLLGYDDDDEDGALAMMRRQREILVGAGEEER